MRFRLSAALLSQRINLSRVAVLALLASGCAPDEKSEASAPTLPPKSAAPVRVEATDKPQPLNASVFLEYSGGMKGFVRAGNANNPATGFQQRVGALLTETQVSAAVAARHYYLVYKDTALQAVSFNKMRDVVLGLQASAALGTELPDMLEGILRRPQAGSEVSVIVSDFIYGPAVKARIPLISNYIRTAVASVSTQKLAVAVLAERSGFYGTYFPAVKTPVQRRQLKGEQIPYYIWIVGPPAQVSRYLAALPPPPAEQAYFGLTFGRVPYGALLTALPTNLMPGGGGTVAQAALANTHDLDVEDAAKTVEFTIGLNLTQLPPAWQQPAFLARQLRPSLAGAVAPAVVAGSVRRFTAAEQATTPALAAYTHTLRLRLTALPAGTSQLTLTLAAPETPAWVAAWSTDDDNLPGPEARTYRLTDIVRGLRGAYPAVLPPVFSLPFSLTNQD